MFIKISHYNDDKLLKTENNTLKDRLSTIEARLLALENNN